jgi:predicted DNA binding protein
MKFNLSTLIVTVLVAALLLFLNTRPCRYTKIEKYDVKKLDLAVETPGWPLRNSRGIYIVRDDTNLDELLKSHPRYHPDALMNNFLACLAIVLFVLFRGEWLFKTLQRRLRY